ncbi:8-oxo-dGTP diphosphatase [Ectothiorhodospira mobilis]|uniref:8-oxo-dGTP diphosphatase n=1 Tax=Ectothiorhodospira mobilis TaxID=195064 RepID=A0A1I4RB85_ECTMO|nr:Nudix family hydrolase [Ectothiorhodospira mobilis]SFM49564.1 8-oxo-dGTP diphosphatase [Ectothiorhodospira mobilis]
MTAPRCLDVAIGVILDPSGACLVARRPRDLPQGGRWEFPGGKVAPGESPARALARELDEELGILPRRAAPLITVAHDYPEGCVRLHVFTVHGYAGSPRGREGQPLRWVPVQDLPGLEFPAANRPILRALSLPDRYLITPDHPDPEAVLRGLARTLEKGTVRLVQLRAPAWTQAEVLALAREAVPLCHRHGARILVNADPQTAAAAGADGVHLNGVRLAQWAAKGARPQVGDGQLVAASVHDADSLGQARGLGCDFVVISPVAPTATHPGARPLGWNRFAELARAAGCPVYALGGMTPAHIPRARARGGQGVAGIRGLWQGEGVGG